MPAATALSSYASFMQTFLQTSTVAAARAALGVDEHATNSIVPLTAGGTGAATAADARAALELPEHNTNSIVLLENGGTSSTNASLARTALGFQIGSGTTSDDGTATNTFTVAFPVAPIVIQTLPDFTGISTNLASSITESNYVTNLGSNGKAYNFIAVEATTP